MSKAPDIHALTGGSIERLVAQSDTSWSSAIPWQFKILLVLVALLFVIWSYRRLVRAIKRRRPPKLNPKLRKYGDNRGDPQEFVAAQRRQEAAKILATSSTPQIAGYELIEQLDAVFVDGFRRPEEALEGLKATAAMKGANAVTSVRHTHGPSGKCSATGDAVIVRKLGAPEPTEIDAHTPIDDNTDTSS